VTSISRQLYPETNDGITRKQANLFKPEEYRECLRGADAVVYSVGTLLEGNYKGFARGEFELRNVATLIKGRNPLKNDPENPVGYEALNRDGGMSFVLIYVLTNKQFL
jgi:hypothetical protein